nr:2-oxo acid dehydrogenase subunit E2 [Nitratireductor luteus]
MFGIKDFSAVINPPHATILAVGAGGERAVVKNGELAVAKCRTSACSASRTSPPSSTRRTPPSWRSARAVSGRW